MQLMHGWTGYGHCAGCRHEQVECMTQCVSKCVYQDPSNREPSSGGRGVPRKLVHSTRLRGVE